MIFKTTRQAAEDLIGIYVEGAIAFGIVQAEAYHDGLIRTFDLLASNPYLARERAEFDPPVRIHPHEAHLIVYRQLDGAILIVRVLHSHQDWARFL